MFDHLGAAEQPVATTLTYHHCHYIFTAWCWFGLCAGKHLFMFCLCSNTADMIHISIHLLSCSWSTNQCKSNFNLFIICWLVVVTFHIGVFWCQNHFSCWFEHWRCQSAKNQLAAAGLRIQTHQNYTFLILVGKKNNIFLQTKKLKIPQGAVEELCKSTVF